MNRPSTCSCVLCALLLLLFPWSVFAQSHHVESIRIVAPPSISVELYQAVLCQERYGQAGAACGEARAMYDLLLHWGIDPAVELAFALKETECGHTGPGRPPQRNLHNIICNSFDGGRCTGPYHARFQAYSSYLAATYAWAYLLRYDHHYEPAGRYTVAQVVPIYAPPFENDTDLYIAQVETWVHYWRSIDPAYRQDTGRSDESTGEFPQSANNGGDQSLSTPTPVSQYPLPAVCIYAAPVADDTPLFVAPGETVSTHVARGRVLRVVCQSGVPLRRIHVGERWVQIDTGAVIYLWVPETAIRYQRTEGTETEGTEHELTVP